MNVTSEDDLIELLIEHEHLSICNEDGGVFAEVTDCNDSVVTMSMPDGRNTNVFIQMFFIGLKANKRVLRLI